MKLCSPEGYPLTRRVGAVDRPRSLDGLRIGLLDNTKPPVDKIMTHLGNRLRERIPGSQIFYISKKHSFPAAPPEAMEALRQNADVVINALGD